MVTDGANVALGSLLALHWGAESLTRTSGWRQRILGQVTPGAFWLHRGMVVSGGLATWRS